MEVIPSGNIIQMLGASKCSSNCFFASSTLFIALSLFLSSDTATSGTKRKQLISNDQ